MKTARSQAATLIGGAFAAAAVLRAFPPSDYHFYPACPLRTWTGLACPLCGSTRALEAVFHGELGAALHANALLILTLPLLAAAVVVALRSDRWILGERLVTPALAVGAAFAVLRNFAPGLLGP